jgi:4-hydroxy-tetrahydrodipicolinate synthase
MRIIMTKGLWVATLTPLAEDGSCDAKALARHCRHLFEAGCEGVALFGTTGEGPSFTVAERRQALETVLREGIPGERIILGAGCAALPDTIELCRAAAETGCAGSLVLPPFFFKGVDSDGVYRAYAEIVEGGRGAALNLYLYNIPSMSAVGLDYDLIGRLAKDFPQAVVGVKDSSLDWRYTAPLLERFRGDLTIYIGAEHHVPQALRAGGAGTSCGLANIAPKLIAQLFDPAKATAALAGVERLIAALDPYFFLTALRAVAASRSGDGGWHRVRAPLHPLSAAEERGLLAAMAALPLDGVG